MREKSQEHLGRKEMNPFKLELAPPNQVISAAVARLFRLLSRSEPGWEVSEPEKDMNG